MTEEQFKAMEKKVRSPKGREARRGTPASMPNGSVTSAAVPGIRIATHASSPYKSKWEAAYASKLELEKLAGYIKDFKYEPFSLWLPGKIRYKPDFLVWREQETDPPHVYSWLEIEVIEVKGWSKNRRDGMTRLKMAAAMFPCFVWRLVYRQGNGWNGEYL